MTPKTMNSQWENSFQDLTGGNAERRAEASVSAPHEVENPSAFMTGGKAYFTLRSTRTGTRFTYRVSANDKGGWFVSLLDGPDNWENYRYIGFIGQQDRRFRVTGKSTKPATATSVRAFAWTWGRLSAGAPLTDGKGISVEVWHEGKCGRCGRKLTVPESIETGFGPECAAKLEM